MEEKSLSKIWEERSRERLRSSLPDSPRFFWITNIVLATISASILMAKGGLTISKILGASFFSIPLAVRLKDRFKKDDYYLSEQFYVDHGSLPTEEAKGWISKYNNIYK